MTDTNLFSLLIVSSFVAYFLALRKARSWQFSENKVSLHSLPTYHGYLSAITTALPAMIVLFLWMFLESSVVSAKIVSSYSELASMNENQSVWHLMKSDNLQSPDLEIKIHQVFIT